VAEPVEKEAVEAEPAHGRVAEVRAYAKRVADRCEAARVQHKSVDAVYNVVDRDIEVGGVIMAGSLAYRLFIWLLPAALVAIGGIGIATYTGAESSESAANSLGLHGLVSHSVAEAVEGSSRWYALLIGLPLLLWATRSLLKVLIVVHRLVWGDRRRLVPRPTVASTVRLLVLVVVYFVILELGRAIESWTGSPALKGLVFLLGWFGWWLVVSMRLPHGNAPWRALVPGAIIVSVGLVLVALVSTYVIAPRVESSRSAYGALGVAATLLFGLYLISRLAVAGAVLNMTLWNRRSERPGG
jgi:uncharacterized BrkB/YihY/UPF0761 family membrane protein